MSKQIKFARVYPAYHKRKSQRTFFVEKILNELGVDFGSVTYLQKLCTLNEKKLYNGELSWYELKEFQDSLNPFITAKKLHTIREKFRFKKGDKFSPVVWAGKPYNSRIITFWDDIEVKKTTEFDITPDVKLKIDTIQVNEKNEYWYYNLIATNDGLSLNDFTEWFKTIPFHGQIIAWNDTLTY